MTSPAFALGFVTDILQSLPTVLTDGTSFLLFLILALAVIVGVLGIISALVDVAMYALVTALAVAGLFLAVDAISVDTALDVATQLLNTLLALTGV